MSGSDHRFFSINSMFVSLPSSWTPTMSRNVTIEPKICEPGKWTPGRWERSAENWVKGHEVEIFHENEMMMKKMMSRYGSYI